jgi:glutamate dehydrogenase
MTMFRASTAMAVASRRGAPRPLIAQMRRTMLTSGATVTPPSDKTAWQAQHNIDIQRVTQTAIIHELTQQQIHTIEKTVPWFLDEMPGSYFRQVPEEFRMDHLKAISAIKDANMDRK